MFASGTSQPDIPRVLTRLDQRFLRRWRRWHQRFWTYLLCTAVGSTLFYAVFAYLAQSLVAHGARFHTWGLPGKPLLWSVGIWCVAVLVSRPAWYMDQEDRYLRLTAGISGRRA